MNEEFDSAISALRDRARAAPVVTDWSPEERGELLIGTLAHVESETRQDQGGHDYNVHFLVVSDVEDQGAHKRIKVAGRAMKGWFGANRDLLKPGVLVAVRFDGTRSTDTAEWREFTVTPDSRNGGSFVIPEDAPPF